MENMGDMLSVRDRWMEYRRRGEDWARHDAYRANCRAVLDEMLTMMGGK